jgi:hypothetical protein
MKKTGKIVVAHEVKKIELKGNTFIEVMEIGLGLVGSCVPIFSVFSLGYNYINKKITNENLNNLAECIQRLEVDVSRLNKRLEISHLIFRRF